MAGTFTPASDESTKAREVQERYRYLRDNGHTKFVEKADKCKRFFRGEQWEELVVQALKAQGRPALTINKILSTVKSLMGQQINNRAELTALPASAGADETALALTKLFKYITRAQQLDWLSTDVCQSGFITGRGFYDLRLEFDSNMSGQIALSKVNAKNVIIDSDADNYDPDEWSDVITTKWLSLREVEMLYGKDRRDYLEAASSTDFAYGVDSIGSLRDRFGGDSTTTTVYGHGQDTGTNAGRHVRLLERQWFEPTMAEHFVDLRTGGMTLVPPSWGRDYVAEHLAQNPGFGVVKRKTKRVKWRHVIDSMTVHDEWSPYKHFTVVPYFPVFDDGHTLGLVEHLIGSQELLNKVSSQELHVVNTTANSGWIVKTGSLANMTVEELEERGAETGLVLEVNDDAQQAVQKIQPNQYPTGLDRISFKAEEHIKTISGVTDNMRGDDREDVAAKAIQFKRQSGVSQFATEFDNMARTMQILGRNMLDIIKEYYTEERIIPLVTDEFTNDTEMLHVNAPDATTGGTINDLTFGEHHVAVSIVPSRELMEDSEFEQAMQMRKEGLPIPDEYVIKNSRLRGRGEIIKKMQEQAASPQAQQQAQLQLENLQLENEKLKAEIAKIAADAGHRQAKTETEHDKAEISAAKLELSIAAHDRDDPREQWAADERRQQMELQKSAMDMEAKSREIELKDAAMRADMQRKAEAHQLDMDARRQRSEAEVNDRSLRNAVELDTLQRVGDAEANAAANAGNQSNNPVKSNTANHGE